MEQYLNLLKEIKENGTWKKAARENMPSTLSLFGYQFKHDLSTGFPALTTKKLFWKGVVTELLWFLRGDTNIKYLVDNGSSFWNEDSYNFYIKQVDNKPDNTPGCGLSFEEFVDTIKKCDISDLKNWFEDKTSYVLGDCGWQYGKLWRDWEYCHPFDYAMEYRDVSGSIDQVAEVINSLQNNPMSRRHIISAWRPDTLDKMALHPCHALVQFNCRPLSHNQRFDWWFKNRKPNRDVVEEIEREGKEKESLWFDSVGVPKYYLDCQLYQRSADVFLGVPFNIASYALLTHIFAKICNYLPGNFVHTFGDVHIYESHMSAVEEQLTREPLPLPELIINTYLGEDGKTHLKDFNELQIHHFALANYQSHPAIKAELSTGMKPLKK